MKKHTYIVWVIFLLLSSSCSDKFLDMAPISSMNEDNFFKTKNDFEAAVNGAYTTLYTIYHPVTGILSHTEQMSDNCTLFHVSDNSEEQQALVNYVTMSNNGFVLNNWNTYYNSLFVINKVLSHLPNSPLDDASRTKYEAEMKFLRAIYYFDMVRLWGDVPLVTKPITKLEESYNYGSNSSNGSLCSNCRRLVVCRD